MRALEPALVRWAEVGDGRCLGRLEVAADVLWLDGREAWDKKYVEVEDEVLFHLILAANFLDIKDLLDLTCKTVRPASLPSVSFPACA